MAIAIAHTGVGGNTSAVSSITTSSFASTTGNLLVAVVRNGSTSTPTSVKNAAGVSLTSLTRQVSGAVSIQFYYLPNITGNPSDNIVATWSGAISDPFVYVWEISGGTTVLPKDVDTGGTNAGSSPITSSAFSTFFNTEIILACASVNATSTTYTAGGSYTLDNGSGGAGTNGQAGTSHLIVSSNQSGVTASFGFSGTPTLAIIAVASFRATAGTLRLLPLLGAGK